jgi:hypothetical protein
MTIKSQNAASQQMGDPNDAKRDQILRFLHDRHKTTRGIHKIPIGIRDLQSAMKKMYAMSQAEVSSNLDYLIQAGWVKEVVKARSFKTAKGMELSQEQVKYKISDVGMNHLEAGTMFKKPQATSNVNITNIQGVTVIGDGNVVNAQFTDLYRALDELDAAIGRSVKLTDEQKLDAAGDLSTIRTQIAKKNPDRGIVRLAWESLKAVATLGGAADAAVKVGQLVAGLIQ